MKAPVVFNQGTASYRYKDTQEAYDYANDAPLMYLQTGEDEKGNPIYTVYNEANNEFLESEANVDPTSATAGVNVESVARISAFGGMAQVALAAGATTYDAIAGRMGVGANGTNLTVADNANGAALWLAPVYKNSSSDGFDADGADYGVDIDLYGLALGADYTLANGLRFGAMFNVGAGDADGQGLGSMVSNDFSYYGFGAYLGYTYNAFSIVGDISYTAVDNDLEASLYGSSDKFDPSLDSSNFSVGVTGQYQIALGSTSVTPHAGLRFSKIDLDDFSDADVGSSSTDDLSVFSVPVGVTVATEFTSSSWTIKPSFDVTLTGNFGDDSVDNTVSWAGTENLHTNLSSEVLDSFTYGATLGVAAKTGNFSLGLGVNYTGSSNVDEFGVNANARFVF